MTLIKKLSAQFFVSITACVCLTVPVSQAEEDSVFLEFVDEVAQRMIAREYKTISTMHHHPMGQYQGRHKEGSCNVENNIRDILSQFGDLKSLKPLSQPAAFIGLGSFSGDQTYWQKLPRAYSFTYEAEYQNAGRGILKMEVIGLNEKPSLKSISFGLYASDQSMVAMQDMAYVVTASRAQRIKSKQCQQQAL